MFAYTSSTSDGLIQQFGFQSIQSSIYLYYLSRPDSSTSNILVQHFVELGIVIVTLQPHKGLCSQCDHHFRLCPPYDHSDRIPASWSILDEILRCVHCHSAKKQYKLTLFDDIKIFDIILYC